VIKINAGNNFDIRNTELAMINAETILRGLAVSGIEIMGIGPDDLGLGLKSLLRLEQKSPIIIVCANISEFLPYIRLRRQGLRVLITSIVDPLLLKQRRKKIPTGIESPEKALSRLLRIIDHDLAIVVMHASRSRIARILSQCPDVDLVIDGESPGWGDNFKRSVRGSDIVPIVYNNKRGQYVNYIDVKMSEDGKLSLSKPKGIKVAVKKVTTDPKIEKIMVEYLERRKQFFREQNRKRRQRINQRMAYGVKNMFLGDHSCQGCHREIWHQWIKSRHAQAIESLQKKGRELDSDCLRCHVTGMMEDNTIGGFKSLTATPGMAGVQCEACHGPGANHAQNPTTNRMLPGKDCLRCHDPENDPNFNFDQKWPRIKH